MRAAVLVVSFGCAALGCFPDFQFGGGDTGGQGGEPSSSRASVGGRDTTSGIGGMPGDGGSDSTVTGHMMSSSSNSGGSTSETSTSTGTGGAVPTVPCGNGQGVLEECMAGEECCISFDSASLDHCENTDDCGFDYYTFSCNAPEDCPGSICCGEIDDIFGFLGFLSCETSCPDSSYRICATSADCEPGETCDQLLADSFAPEYKNDYRFCSTR